MAENPSDASLAGTETAESGGADLELAEVLGAPPPCLTGRVAARLGPDAADLLRADPWALLAVPALRPERADALARSLLGDAARPDDPRRARGIARWLLERGARDGHTVVTAATVRSVFAGYGMDRPDAALDAVLDDTEVESFVVLDGDTPRAVLGLSRYAAAEEAIADSLERLLATADPLAVHDGGGRPDTPDGGSAALRAFDAPGVNVLLQGAGADVAGVLRAARERAGGRRCALVAPTGRAAAALAERTGAAATTIRGFVADRGAELTVVDGVQSLDVTDAAAVLAAVPDGGRVLLCGDIAELPPAGPGRVLTDVVTAGAAAVTELVGAEETALTGLAAAVRAGYLPPVHSPDREVVIVSARDDADATRRAVQLVVDSIPRALQIPPRQVQVLTPLWRGTAGAAALNATLKQHLNPGPGSHEGFDAGDRVVTTADLGVPAPAGEVGVVTAADGHGPAAGVTVEFSGGTVRVTRPDLGYLRHGWAISVHQARGARWPAIVAVLPGEAAGALSRPLVYTAVGRALRHLSVVHGAGPALARGVADVAAPPRRTRLGPILRGEG
ncbi:MAG: AAA family ATPase [Carbonactinosporaceae bacterium]